MSDILVRIKRAVVAGNVDYSEKARLEMLADHLQESDIRDGREHLHIIKGTNLDGEEIYTRVNW